SDLENAGLALGETPQRLAFFGVHPVVSLRSQQGPLLPEFRGGSGAQLQRRSALAPARRERSIALARPGELRGPHAGGKKRGRSRRVHHQDAAAVGELGRTSAVNCCSPISTKLGVVVARMPPPGAGVAHQADLGYPSSMRVVSLFLQKCPRSL